MNFEYRKYRNEDKKKVLELLSGLWDMTYDEKLEYFNWKYEQNPYSDSPLAFVALDGEKIVSFRGYMPQPLIISGNTFLNASLSDTVTDSNYRRMGLFSGITKFSIEQLSLDDKYKVSLNSSSGGPTLNGYIKLGWRPLAKREHIFSFSIKGLISMPNDIKYPIVVKFGDKTIIISEDIRSEEIYKLYQKKRDNSKIVINKDEKYLKWRFKNPRSRYLFAYYYINDNLEAYCSFKFLGINKLDLIDYETTNFNYLKQLISKVKSESCIRQITLWTTNENDIICNNKIFFGFIKIPFLNKTNKFKKPPFLIRTSQLKQKSEDWIICNMIDMRDNKNWSLNKIIGDEI